MEKAERHLGWGWFWASLGGAAVIALIAAPELPSWSVKVLVLFIGIAFTISFYYFGWLRLQQRFDKIRTTVLLCIICVGVLGLAYKVWPEPKRLVIVTRIEVFPYQLGKPVSVDVHVLNRDSPDLQTNSYFQLGIDNDVIVPGSDPHEQRKIEDANWSDFIKTTEENAAKVNVPLTLPVGKGLSLHDQGMFTDDQMRALISGQKSLYIVGMIRDVSREHMTPYCVIKTPHMPGIAYCQGHN